MRREVRALWGLPEVREKSDNRADVTNETEQKQKARVQREKMIRVVFIKKGDKVEQRKVETGIADTTDIEIKSGVTTDEVLAISNVDQSSDGVAVRQ